MSEASLYDAPDLYDRLVPPGPCEPFYLDLADRVGGPVLELACGSGRLTLPLARGGREVVGLDVSPAMLDAARVKAVRAGLEVRWVRGDMETFDLNGRFGLILVSCNSLGHLTEPDALDRALRRIREHLAPGGLFAFDVVNPRRPQLRPPDRPVTRRGHGGSALKVRERARYCPTTQVREAVWTVTTPDGDAEFGPLRLRQYLPDDLPRALDRAGFSLRERFGGFDRRPYRASASPLQVCVASPA